MQTLTLEAQPRTAGKGPARAARRNKEVPAVLYGPHAEPVHFTVPALAMRPLIHTTETYRVALRLDGAQHDCLLKHVDYDPITDVPAHADFFALTVGEAVTMQVPLVLVGTAPGIREGGDLAQPLHALEVRALPKDLPGHIDVDVSNLNLSEAIHVGDLQVPNVEVLTDAALPIVMVSGKRTEIEETTEEDVAAEE